MKHYRKTAYAYSMKQVAALAVVVFLSVAPVPGLADQNDPKLDDLFLVLRSTDDPAKAQRTEGEIWVLWVKRGVEHVDELMAAGIQAMNAGALHTSVTVFDRVIAMAPDYAEAWNKRATVYFMMGRFDESVGDIQKTLTLEPRHFGALSGMGMIYQAIGKPQAAIEIWQKALTINPHLAGLRRHVDEVRRGLKGRKI